MLDVVQFKSFPSFFAKEKSGVKNNTVRVATEMDDERFTTLRYWYHSQRYGKIRITNSDTGDYFERQIRDITFWMDMWIISWEHSD